MFFGCAIGYTQFFNITYIAQHTQYYITTLYHPRRTLYATSTLYTKGRSIHMTEPVILSRRAMLGCLCGAVASAVTLPMALSSPVIAATARDVRRLKLRNLHTEETLDVVYFEKGNYVAGALQEIHHLLRDHRNDAVHPIDVSLLDSLHRLQRLLRSNGPFQIISGYRSPESNAMLREKSGKVAKNSLHMEGRAIDIRLPDRSLSEVRMAALSLQQGGVGYYPKSNFVHLDTGPFRRW